MTEQSTNTTDRTPFTTYLLGIDQGRVESDATDLVADAVRAVEKTAKKATVTVIMTISPVDSETFNETGELIVEATAKANLPQIARSPAIFYATGVDGQMTRDVVYRNDPRFDSD